MKNTIIFVNILIFIQRYLLTELKAKILTDFIIKNKVLL